MVRKIDAAQLDAASRTLAAAFANDPFWIDLLQEPRLFDRCLPPAYDLVTRYGYRYGVIWSTESLDAISVWLPSTYARASLWQELQCGGLRVAAALGPRRALRMIRALEYMARQRQRLLPEPHVYLWALGVRPDRQGQGLGSELLRFGLEICDQEHRSVYLETHTPRNVRFYERHGFVVKAHAPVPGLGTPQWLMVRSVPGA